MAQRQQHQKAGAPGGVGGQFMPVEHPRADNALDPSINLEEELNKAEREERSLYLLLNSGFVTDPQEQGTLKLFSVSKTGDCATSRSGGSSCPTLVAILSRG